MAEDSKDLLERALAGDHAAQDELIKQCYNLMKGVARSFGFSSDEIRDVGGDFFHDVFVKVFLALSKLNNKSRPALLSLVKKAITNRIIDELRRRGRWKFAKSHLDDEGQDIELDLPDDHPEANPEEAILNNEKIGIDQAKLERLKECRDELTPAHRTIYDFLLNGETLAKIAKEIHKSITFAHHRRKDIFAQLRECLERQH